MDDSSIARGWLAPLAGAGLLSAAGLAHLGLSHGRFEEVAYLGLLFLAASAGAIAAVFGILRARGWGWLLGALAAGSALAAYLVDGTVGLPGAEPGGLLEPAGVLAAALDALFLVVCASEILAGFGRRGLAVGTATVLATAGLAAALILAGFGTSLERAGGHRPPARHDAHNAAQANRVAADRP